MNRKVIAIIVLGLVLLASLLACGYFGMKALRTNRLRRAALDAYEKKDYAKAEPLLLQYVRKDPNAETEFVALASIYHEFGNTGAEAQMWQTASSLNPLNAEYRERMLTTAARSASYDLLHGILGRKDKVGETLTDQEVCLYIISSFRTGYLKDADDAYKKRIKADREAFQKNELGRLAEFMAKYSDLSDPERDEYLNQALKSEDPVIRFEALYIIIRRAEQNGDEDRMEALLKQAAEVNYYVGTPLLADFYFSKYRFGEVIDLAEPYLKSIDSLSLYLQYMESCVFTSHLDELKTVEKKLRRKSGLLPILADYCLTLIAFLENDEEKLADAVRKSGNVIDSPLSRLIRLRVALANGSTNEIRAIAQKIFYAEPFYDLHNRALLVCLDYISKEMQKPENQKDPSQMADLAKVLESYIHGHRLLTEIILMDQYKKGLVKEDDLLTALEDFPDDGLLQRIAAEYLILKGNADRALTIIEQILEAAEAAKQEPDQKTRFLHMLALDQLGRHDEAAVIFRELVEQFEFDLELLGQYFQFCEKNKREADLSAMAGKLETVKDGKLEHYGKFFRAAALLATGDKDKEKEALDLLVSTPAEDPEFTFYAATQLSRFDWLDEAEAKYKAILKTYRTPSLPYVNLSIIYHAKGEEQKALEAAKEAFDLEKKSILPAFIYAQRLSEAKRYEDAVNALNFPRHPVNYRKEIVELWIDCMHHVIENSIAGERYMQAEEQCKHLLVISPDDEFGKKTMEKVRELLKTNKDTPGAENASAVPAA